MLVVGYVIGHLVMSIYSMSGDSLMHCFLLDEDVNQGVAKSHCPEQLRKFMSEERDE
jgi:hypothetical protein